MTDRLRTLAGFPWRRGANAGYAINPARDLGPRLLAWLEGWVYDLLIRDVLIARGAKPDPEIVDKGETAIDEPGGATG